MMLDLPEKFKTNIFNRYGQKGKDWLKNLDSLVEKYTKKFQLSDIQLIENLSINLVLFAKSELYGDVIMKIGTPGPTSLTEINIMKCYSSKYVPKCYYSCVDDRVMLLERIFPGYPLTHLKNLEERIKIFAELANHLLIPANENENFLTFEEIFKEKINYVHENKTIFSDILWMIDIAIDLYNELQTMNLPKYILHNDLHHKNILKTSDSWKAIDPHGIVGERVFECCNFIRSEMENTYEDKMDEIISLVSQYFEEDRKLIFKALYVYIIQKIIFYIKNKSDANRIAYNIKICKEILKSNTGIVS